MNIGQNQRPEHERNLPLWQIEALDRQRAELANNMRANPAIWQKLNELESKIDKILAMLAAGQGGKEP
jgi:hypothetical protein